MISGSEPTILLELTSKENIILKTTEGGQKKQENVTGYREKAGILRPYKARRELLELLGQKIFDACDIGLIFGGKEKFQ